LAVKFKDFTIDFCGTKNYMAPEMLYLDEDNEPCGYAIDIWSAGITIAELISGKLLFEGDSTASIDNKIGKYVDDKAKWLDEFFLEANELEKDLVMKMLHEDPKLRITLEEALNHPYFADIIKCKIF